MYILERGRAGRRWACGCQWGVPPRWQRAAVLTLCIPLRAAPAFLLLRVMVKATLNPNPRSTLKRPLTILLLQVVAKATQEIAAAAAAAAAGPAQGQGAAAAAEPSPPGAASPATEAAAAAQAAGGRGEEEDEGHGAEEDGGGDDEDFTEDEGTLRGAGRAGGKRRRVQRSTYVGVGIRRHAEGGNKFRPSMEGGRSSKPGRWWWWLGWPSVHV